jgi:hypothetical protein
MEQSSHETRVERVLGAPLAADAVRRWPQSGEVIRGKVRIARVESHFRNLKLAITRRHSCGAVVVVEWNSDYGDGRVYRNVTIGELLQGEVVRVTDYWGEPFTPPQWRHELSESEVVWPHADELISGQRLATGAAFPARASKLSEAPHRIDPPLVSDLSCSAT